jgi:hypothetical protein
MRPLLFCLTCFILQASADDVTVQVSDTSSFIQALQDTSQSGGKGLPGSLVFIVLTQDIDMKGYLGVTSDQVLNGLRFASNVTIIGAVPYQPNAYPLLGLSW